MAKTRNFEADEYLETPEDIANFLNEALETGDASFVARAIGIAARARGMTDVARETGMSRENLYRSLSGESRPEFETIIRVLGALGVQLEAKPRVA